MHKGFVLLAAATILAGGIAFAALNNSKPAQPAPGGASPHQAVKPASTTAAKSSSRSAAGPSSTKKSAPGAVSKPGGTKKGADGKMITEYVGPLKKLPRRTPPKGQ